MIDTLKPLPRRETLGSHVLRRIKELLLTGKLMPGEQLSLRSTAQALGVSMMPVRQAVYQLVAEQALEVAPNRSVRVPVMTAAQFGEITRIRLLVESYAVERAARHATAELVQSLNAINTSLSERMGAGEAGLADTVLLNQSLHFSIYAASGMPMLVDMIESLWLRIGPVLNYDLRSGSERVRNRTAVKHHADLIDALARREGAQAAHALRQDIESAYHYIMQRNYTAAASRAPLHDELMAGSLEE